MEQTPKEKAMTLVQLVGDAHQIILNAPREKDYADKQAMRLLEIAVGRLQGIH